MSRHSHRGRIPLRLGACAILLLLGGCAGMRDGGPDRPVDVAAIPNAVPRVEPRSPYGNPTSYVVDGRRYYVLKSSRGFVQRGIASWYGTKFAGHRTASGAPYDMYAMTAAHRTLPIPTFVRVTNLRNGRSVIVRINDRGPFVPHRILDLSWAAAAKLGMLPRGTAPVEIRAIDPRRWHTPPRAPATRYATSPHTTLRATAYPIGASAPAPAPEPLPRRDPPAKRRTFLQAGAFAVWKNARDLQRRLRDAHLSPVRIRTARRHGRPIYRVQIGPLNTPARAQSARGALARLGIRGADLVVD